jgi:type III secretion protein Q
VDPRPFPWHALPRADRRAGRLAAALAAWTGARPDARRWADVPTAAGPARIRAGAARVLAGPALGRALADPSSAACALRIGTRAAYVVASGRLVRALAHAVLGGPDELAAPRAPTPAERGVLAFAVAAALDAVSAGAGTRAEPSDTAGPLLAAELGEAAVIELEVDGAAAGWAALVVPMDLVAGAPPPRPLTLPACAWVDEPALVAPVVVATARLAAARVAALAARDVVVLDRPPGGIAELRLGRGRVPVTLAPGAGGVTVGGVYARGAMSDTLAEDAAVEVSACAGSVTLSVRELIELAPGQVLAMGRPVGGAVELRVGRQVVGRGELVDVDGELGVRVLSVEAGATVPAAGPAPGEAGGSRE